MTRLTPVVQDLAMLRLMCQVNIVVLSPNHPRVAQTRPCYTRRSSSLRPRKPRSCGFRSARRRCRRSAPSGCRCCRRCSSRRRPPSSGPRRPWRHSQPRTMKRPGPQARMCSRPREPVRGKPRSSRRQTPGQDVAPAGFGQAETCYRSLPPTDEPVPLPLLVRLPC
jgi:hypothetical protein